MMLLTGQPFEQKGMPQSMQRAPWRAACSSVSALVNSFQCSSRCNGASAASAIRSNSRKPVILPMFSSLGGNLLRVGTAPPFGQRAALIGRNYLDEFCGWEEGGL